MTLWLRARRPWWMLAALVVMVAVDRLVGEVSLSVPALFGGGADFVFVRTYLPLLWAAAVADSFAGRGLSIEVRPARLGRTPASRLGLHDAGLLLVASTLAGVVFSVLAADGWTAIGPVLVLAGVACLETLRAGPAVGAFTSTMLMLLTSVYPRTAPGARFVHVLQPDGVPAWSLAVGVVLALAAAGVLAAGSAHTRFGAAEASAL